MTHRAHRTVLHHLALVFGLLAPVACAFDLAPVEEVDDTDDLLAAEADECVPDHEVTVTATKTVCAGDVLCACIDARGNMTVEGPLSLGQTCRAGCAPFQADATMDPCTLAGEANPAPQCPASCTPMGGPTGTTSRNLACCTSTKKQKCCCPGDAVEAD
jgi:hypothetical protein